MMTHPAVGLKPVEALDFTSLLRTGDCISFGQACSEPVGLVRRLLGQGEHLHRQLGRLGLFVAGSYSGLLSPHQGEWFDFYGYGCFGDSTALAKAGVFQIHPVPYSRLPDLLMQTLQVDVALLQLSPPDAHGRFSLGVANDFQLAVARNARLVIAEVNPLTPFSPSALLPDEIRPHHWVASHEPLVEVLSASPDPLSLEIARHVVPLIPDGATLQMGVGSLMAAVCQGLTGHQNLGIHSGILTEGLVDLIQKGVVNNSRKGTHSGQSVVGSLLGGQRLFDFADQNHDLCLVETEVTHGHVWLSRQKKLCSINSAIEVDLSGQVNAEVARGRYVGAVGGQPDYVRAAVQSEGGLSVIALPSSAAGGKVSRIVASLSGPVTTARCDVDYVVTEWGVASLRGLSLRQRAHALIQIAHPDHREELIVAAAANAY